MTQQTAVKQNEQAQPDKIPGRWGLSEARFFSDCENELIAVHLRSVETMIGYVVGLDQFGIGLEVEGVPHPVWVMKHAIDYITRAEGVKP